MAMVKYQYHACQVNYQEIKIISPGAKVQRPWCPPEGKTSKTTYNLLFTLIKTFILLSIFLQQIK